MTAVGTASPPRTGQDSRLRSSFLSLLALNLYFFGVYTNISFGITPAVAVPNIFGIIATVIMIILGATRDDRTPIAPLLTLIGFLAVSTLVANSGLEYLSIRIPSFVQMTAALVSFFIAVNFMLQFSASTLRRVFLGWLIFLVVGCVVEVYTPVRGLSDEFRRLAYSDRFLYGGLDRDISLYGRSRPKLFTQEPSHVAKAFVAFSVAWHCLSVSKSRTFVVFVLTAVTAATLRSPFVLLAIPLTLTCIHIRRMSTSVEPPFVQTRRRVSPVPVMLPVLATVMAGVGSIAFARRWESLASGSDFSFFSRFVGPFLVARETLSDYPLFGVGLGAKEFLFPYFNVVFAEFGSSRYLFDIYLVTLGNGLANSLTFFGIVGAVLFYVLLTRLFRVFGPSMGFVGTLIALCFFNMDGAIEGIRMWGYIAIVVGANVMAREPLLAHHREPLPR
jgi:hypothetical protein